MSVPSQQPLLMAGRQPHSPQLHLYSSNQSEPVSLSCMSETLLYWSKGTPFRVVVGIACCLSILGALLIIFSYACFKSLRSRARLVLVHLSLMDLGVGLMNLLGNLVHFDSYYVHTATSANNESAGVQPDSGEELEDVLSVCQYYLPPVSIAVQRACIAQAFLAQYFTYSSVLWTMALAIYIYFIIVHYRKSYISHVLIFSYVLCYGIPVMLCLWILLTGRLGYSPANGLWCSIVLRRPGETTGDTFVTFFGYDLWIYLTFLIVPIFFIAVKLFIRDKILQTKMFLPEAEKRFWEALYILDYKFLLVPIFFFFLRVWACIQLMIHYYFDVQVPTAVHIALDYLTNIGDSSQGFANAILFVLFTKKVRETILNLRYWRKKLCCRIRRIKLRMDSTSTDSNTNPPIESEILTPSKFTESLAKSVSLQIDSSRRHIAIN